LSDKFGGVRFAVAVGAVETDPDAGRDVGQESEEAAVAVVGAGVEHLPQPCSRRTCQVGSLPYTDTCCAVIIQGIMPLTIIITNKNNTITNNSVTINVSVSVNGGSVIVVVFAIVVFYYYYYQYIGTSQYEVTI